MSIWTKQRLNDLCEKIASGGTPSRAHPEYYAENGGHLWVKSKELLEKGIDDTEEKISNAGLDNSSAKYYPMNSVLVAMYGANAGQMAWLKKPATVNQAICALVVDPQKADWRFVYYSLLESRQALVSLARGGAQPNLNKEMVETFQVSVTKDVFVQKEISGILGTYDDLIENNNKRIRILNEITELLYAEWFVRFRFPGYQKVKLVDSATFYNQIPEGWKVVRIGNRFMTILGGTPSRANASYWDNGTVPWINSGAVNKLRIVEASEFITDAALEKSATKMMPKRTTLLAITGATLGQVSLSEIECCANQSVVGIYDVAGKANEYIYLRVKDEIKNIVALAGGGAQQHINKEIVNNKEFLLPSEKILEKFSQIVAPIFDEVANLLFLNANLARTRDLLLPELITGRRRLKESVISPIQIGKSKDVFKDAVIFSYYINKASTPSFQPTHLRAVKSVYFANRFCGVDPVLQYAEDRFGPYNPRNTYAGGESVAIKKKYVERIKGGFKPGVNADEVSNYSYKELSAVDKVLSFLKYKKDVELELLSTVDYILYKMLKNGDKPTADSVYGYIEQSKAWKQKVDRLKLSVDKVSEAMNTLRDLAKNGLIYPIETV